MKMFKGSNQSLYFFSALEISSINPSMALLF